jgi:hypothetical protein
MDATDVISMIVRWFHIGAAITAIGGAAFVRIALRPAAHATLTGDEHDNLHEAVRTRWLRVVHMCIAILLITGAVNFYLLALRTQVDPMPYHAVFGIKFLCAIAIFFIASALYGRAPGFAGMRAKSAKWLSILLLLAVVVIMLSGALNMIRATALKPIVSPPPPAVALEEPVVPGRIE